MPATTTNGEGSISTTITDGIPGKGRNKTMQRENSEDGDIERNRKREEEEYRIKNKQSCDNAEQRAKEAQERRNWEAQFRREQAAAHEQIQRREELKSPGSNWEAQFRREQAAIHKQVQRRAELKSSSTPERSSSSNVSSVPSHTPAPTSANISSVRFHTHAPPRGSSANISTVRSYTSDASTGKSTLSGSSAGSMSSTFTRARTEIGSPTDKTDQSASSGTINARASSTSSAAFIPTGASATGASPIQSTPLPEADWKRRMEEEHQKRQEQFRREQERLKAARLSEMSQMSAEDVVQLIEHHERVWSRLPTLEELHWSDIPWPMFKRPSSAEDITYTGISAYIHCKYQPDKDKTIKDRIKDHIRRWHPESRFAAKLLSKIMEEDKEKVKEGASAVVRNLNELLARTNSSGLFDDSGINSDTSATWRTPIDIPRPVSSASQAVTQWGRARPSPSHSYVPQIHRRTSEDEGQAVVERWIPSVGVKYDGDRVLSSEKLMQAEDTIKIAPETHMKEKAQNEEDQRRKLEMKRSAMEVQMTEQNARDKEEDLRRRVEETAQKEEAVRQREEAVMKMEEAVREKEEAVKQREEEARLGAEEVIQKAEVAIQKEREVRIAEEEIKKKTEENKKMGDELTVMEEDVRQRREVVMGKEEDIRHAEEEIRRKEQQLQLWEDKLVRQEEELKWYNDARDILTNVCSNKPKCDQLLGLDQSDLQLVLDLMQMVLEHSYTCAYDFENVLLKAMLRVAKRHTLCPRSYVLSGIERGEYPIASGHFGEVFQGDYNGQRVSLKVFKLYSSEMSKLNQLIMAFYKEAILWRHLSHRNLLPFYGIYQLGDSGKRICLVSPWMNEGNITQYLERNPQANRRYLALDVARGISYLHRKSIVHGDLKGVNVLVSDAGVACLADFGLSSVIVNTPAGVWSSSTVSTAGTVRWQAPELIGGSDDSFTGRTKESDIYAFACVCYEIFVGKMPFYEILNDVTVMHKVMILGQRPLRPEVDSDPCTQWDLTDWMWSLIEECWSQDAAARPLASDVVAKLSSRNEFLRDDDDGHRGWGDLQPEMFRSLVHQQPTLLKDDVQRCLALLNAL